MFFVNYMSTMNYDADGFVLLLDTVEDDAELDDIVVDTFDVLTCSTTFAGVLCPLRRRIAAFFSAKGWESPNDTKTPIFRDNLL